MIALLLLIGCIGWTNALDHSAEKVGLVKCCERQEVLLEGKCTSATNSTQQQDFAALFETLLNRSFNDSFYIDGERKFHCPPDRVTFIMQVDDGLQIADNGDLSWENDKADTSQYCLEIINDEFAALTCQKRVERSIYSDWYTTGMIISIPFLFVTLLVYLVLPDKKLRIKCLLAYMTCLMLSYLSLVYLNFQGSVGEDVCIGMAATGIYFFLATFFWMNVTCIDMYWTFSGRRGFQGMMAQSKSRHWKQFGYYALFANGSPVIFIVIIFVLNTYPKHLWFHPGIGEMQCWLKDGHPKLLYFYSPMAVLLIVNVCLFVMTTMTIRRNLSQNQKVMRNMESQRHNESNIQDFRLYVKLFIAMGINWIMEFISWLVDWLLGENKVPAVWYLTDFCNAVYGVFIFIIFVCKRTIWIKLRQRYYILMGKPNMARALSSRASGYQMSQTEKTGLDDMTVTNIN